MQSKASGTANPDQPSPLHCCSASSLPVQLDDKHLVVFGGINKRERYADLWLLNLEEKAWSEVILDGPCPEPRAHFTVNRCDDGITAWHVRPAPLALGPC